VPVTTRLRLASVAACLVAAGLQACGEATGPPKPLALAVVGAGGGHSCGLTLEGVVYCWGANDAGQLGIGASDTNPHPTPERTTGGGGLGFVALSVGDSHACALTADGSAYCWGAGRGGRLGDGSGSDRATPVPVQGGLAFASLSAGGEHTCAVTRAGVAYCWGANSRGQLGDSSTTDRLVPARVAGTLAFVSVTAGAFHSCGLAAGSVAYCWGDNSEGQLGDTSPASLCLSSCGRGPISGSFAPVPVSAGLVFASLTAGTPHSCGVATGGAAYCWGDGAYGQLGNGSQNNSLVPVPVVGGLAFTSLSARQLHTCGIAAADTAYCWGWNPDGQLGIGSTSWNGAPGSTTPARVSGGLFFSSISAGGDHTCALTPAGAAYCWGAGSRGQLGNGATQLLTVPVPVAGVR